MQQLPPEAEGFLGFSYSLVDDRILGQGSQLPDLTSIQNGVISCGVSDAEQPGQDGLVCLMGELPLQFTQLTRDRDRATISGTDVSCTGCKGPAASSSVTMKADLLFDFFFLMGATASGLGCPSGSVMVSVDTVTVVLVPFVSGL